MVIKTRETPRRTNKKPVTHLLYPPYLARSHPQENMQRIATRFDTRRAIVGSLMKKNGTATGKVERNTKRKTARAILISFTDSPTRLTGSGIADSFFLIVSKSSADKVFATTGGMASLINSLASSVSLVFWIKSRIRRSWPLA